MVCQNCGQQIADGSTVCPHCQAVQQPGPAPAQPAASFQPFYAPPPPVPAAVQRTSGLAIASMVVGIVSILVSCILWPLGAVLAAVALVLGIVGLNETSKDPSVGGKGMAIAGIVLGGIGVLLVILAIAGLALLAPRISDIFGQIYNSLQ